MILTYPGRDRLYHTLREAEDSSLDFILIVAGAIEDDDPDALSACLNECVRALRDGGLLFIHGRPEQLAEIGVNLDRHLTFKYWIVAESRIRQEHPGLPSTHAAVLLFSKGDAFNVKRTRAPHLYCAFCNKSLKDWGGKTHLMHPNGHVITDVWRHLPSADNLTCVSTPLLETILSITDLSGTLSASEPVGIIGPAEGTGCQDAINEPSRSISTATRPHGHVNDVDPDLLDVIHHDDVLDALGRYPDNSIDLVFADPPYNLRKSYNVCDDGWNDQQYIDWCSAWLSEYVRVLKPTGSLYVLNLPRWSMYHADFLNRHLHFRNWIVWDALSDPRGKLLPAHYGLLFYTKLADGFTFNYDEVDSVDARCFCRRASCISKRKPAGVDDKEPLTDIWWDIHRIRHRRDRDHHPCQLPDALLERIIRLSTNEGDVVLDAFCGVGTCPTTASRLGRRYVGIDIDASYVDITRRKLAEIKLSGCTTRTSTRKLRHQHTKKELHMELRHLALKLGRLPTPEDVRAMSRYDPDVFLQIFSTWSKALAAAKIEIRMPDEQPESRS